MVTNQPEQNGRDERSERQPGREGSNSCEKSRPSHAFLDLAGFVHVMHSVTRNDLEHIAIRIAEEKPLERRFAPRCDYFGSVRHETFLQPSKLGSRVRNGNVPAEFLFVRGDLEIRHRHQVQLLIIGDPQPGRRHRCIGGAINRRPPKRLFKKASRRRNVPRPQRNVQNRHLARSLQQNSRVAYASAYRIFRLNAFGGNDAFGRRSCLRAAVSLGATGGLPASVFSATFRFGTPPCQNSSTR
jgi:hypothetical protein